MYKTSTRINRKHDDVIASQIDFGREQAKKKDPELSFKQPIVAKVEQTEKKCPSFYEPVRSCKFCGKSIPKGKLYPPQYRERDHCSRGCAQSARWSKQREADKVNGILPPSPRICEFCGEPYEKKDNDSKAVFGKRKFCSLKCKGQALTVSTKKPINKNPIELKTDTPSPWETIKATMAAFGASEKSIAQYQKVFDMGVKYGASTCK